MDTDNKLIFEAFLESVSEKAYIMISYSDRGMEQTKITTVLSHQLPEILIHGAIKILGDKDSLKYVQIYEPEKTNFEQALKLVLKENIVFSCNDGGDIVFVFHDLESVYNNLIDVGEINEKTAKQIMQRLIDDNAVDYFYYGKGNHFRKPAHAVFYKTSANPQDWYEVNSVNEVGEILGTTLSDAFGSRDFEQPENPNREDSDDDEYYDDDE